MICPFLELTDPRCSAHFSLTNLVDAFTHCVGRYQGCPVYSRMLRDRAGAMPMLHAAARQGSVAGRLAG